MQMNIPKALRNQRSKGQLWDRYLGATDSFENAVVVELEPDQKVRDSGLVRLFCFNGSHVHPANHDVMLWAVSRAPLAKLQDYKRDDESDTPSNRESTLRVNDRVAATAAPAELRSKGNGNT